MSGRKLAIARRKAMSQGGKQALGTQNTGTTTPSQRQRTKPSSDAAVQSAPATQTPKRSAGRRRATANTSAPSSNARSASLMRRQAMSTRGKSAVQSTDRVRSEIEKRQAQAKAAAQTTPSEEKKGDCGCGCKGKKETARRPARSSRPMRTENTRSSAKGNGRNGRSKRPSIDLSPARAASLARRKAQSTRGKGGISQSGMTTAQTVRSTNPDLSSRDLAKALREQRSKRGGSGQKKSAPSGRRRPSRSAQKEQGASKDQPWKVGISETTQGQQVSGTMTGRSVKMTGDEPSTCRPVTGTEYMGADVFREFCQTEPVQAVAKVRTTTTAQGQTVTGNKVGRKMKVTGDEQGTCKNVTGTEYVGAEQNEAYCGITPTPGPSKIAIGKTNKEKTVTGNLDLRSERVTGDETGAGRRLTGSQYTQLGDPKQVPAKVRESSTMRGKVITGPLVGRSEKMTGDEMGSCRNVTGDEYISAEQFRSFCNTAPAPTDQKVGVSSTFNGETITGTMTGPGQKVTGDEPGTCKAITGTPYAGIEQYGTLCEAPVTSMAVARMHQSKRAAGMPMTGLQPAVGGDMTGDAKGACQSVSGTPYVGADQQATVCPSQPAGTNSPDFPQTMNGNMPWDDFSTTPPNHATDMLNQLGGVTGSTYEQGQITGPFGMAPGMVTGTEQARFGQNAMPSTPVIPEVQDIDGRTKSRISGEGLDGMKITGDAWDRGDRVTGTEGTSAMKRNQTRRGGDMAAMAMLRVGSRNEDVPTPISKVTGASGNTDKGSLITYSGGARG